MKIFYYYLLCCYPVFFVFILLKFKKYKAHFKEAINNSPVIGILVTVGKGAFDRSEIKKRLTSPVSIVFLTIVLFMIIPLIPIWFIIDFPITIIKKLKKKKATMQDVQV